MTDDLNDLKSALKAATPAPDPETRAAHLRLAEKNFDTLQETAKVARPTPNRLLKGVQIMFKGLTTKGALTLTTAVVAVGFVAITPFGRDLLLSPEDNEVIVTEAAVNNTTKTNPTSKTAVAETVVEETIGEEEAEQTEQPQVTDNQRPAPPPIRGTSGSSTVTPIEIPPAGEDSESNDVAEPEIAMTMDDVLDTSPSKPLAGELPEESSVIVHDALGIQGTVEAPVASEAETGRNYAGALPYSPSPSAENSPSGGLQEHITGASELGIVGGSDVYFSDQDAFVRIAPSQPNDQIAPQVEPDTEAFPEAEVSPLKVTLEEPVSTFSIDVDTAAYSVVRSSLMNGYMPPRDAVRVEEMINYFPYDYASPEGDVPFLSTIQIGASPWNADKKLVHIALQGAQVTERPPLNLVFLIDTSGSMNRANKLPLLKQSFRLMLSELRPEDEVSIVTYAGSAGQVLEPTKASDRTTIMAALDNLSAGGSTAGQAGLQQAYAVAETMADEGEVTRVILATDGDFNVGLSDPDALKDYIADKRDTGTYLSVLGFGRGNLDDATMQALAQNGNGQASYIDTLSEAQKVLVDQLTGALFPIANDVKIQIEFNPATVAEYRLIGYETRALKREDFNNDKVDAGEIGAGHSVTAIYEITPVGSPAVLNDPLRYQQASEETGSDELGFLKLRYKAPGENTSKLIQTPLVEGDALDNEARFAAAITGFAQLLRGDDSYLGDWSYDDAIALANGARGDDPFGYRSEAVKLMRLAKSLDQN